MRARLRRLAAGAAALALAAATVLLWRLDARVRAYLAGPPTGAIRIYAAPAVLRPGGRVPGGSLVRALVRLGYRPATGATVAPGEFRVASGTVELAQRPSPVPWAAAPHHVRIKVHGDEVTAVLGADGTALPRLELEPETLAVLGRAGAALAADAAAPPACRAAVLAAEDRHFFRHPGIDPAAIGRALLVDLRAGARLQGGSTLTQQLVKNAFLSPRRTVGRKVREALLALLLEAHASKEDILRRYLASVYLGVDAGVPVHGFAQAAEVYFGAPLPDLDTAQCALLAGMIRSPNALDPRTHARAALGRRNHVLRRMALDGVLDPAVARAAAAEPLRIAPPRSRPVGALYVADEVRRALRHLLPADAADTPGLTVFTSVDADAQRAAERAVRQGVDALERRRARRRGQPRLEAALVALDPTTGRIRALVGGRDYRSSPLDRAVRARRQPGSAFKPFVYLAALDPSRRGAAPERTLVSPLDDEPLALRTGAGPWRPVNYDGRFHGTVPLEDAFAESLNVATVRLALDVGLDAVVRTAADLGVPGPLPRVPALALGVAGTSLLDLTAAYAVLAGGGLRRPPTLVIAVTAPDGDTLYAAPPEATRVVTPQTAFLMTALLEGVIDRGTGRPARALGLTGAAAGKTGTTDDTRDAWFVGYTPRVVAGVWVGTDGGAPTGFTGAQAALPVWTAFVRATASEGPGSFAAPPGVVWRSVDPETGLLAAGCPEARRVPFLAGTEPTATCDRHRAFVNAVGERVDGVLRGVEDGGRRIGDWLHRLFR